jgi:proton translocating ATP synthase F1 alpha subunit
VAQDSRTAKAVKVSKTVSTPNKKLRDHGETTDILRKKNSIFDVLKTKHNQETNVPENYFKDFGRVISITDGVAKVAGIHEAQTGERVKIGSKNVAGLVLSLENKTAGVVVFGNERDVEQNALVRRTADILSIPITHELFGRVIDSLGNIIDDGPSVQTPVKRRVDTKAIGIIPRQSIDKPMQTGITTVDSLTPIGCGQRELIIGDRQSGKTTIAIDAIINQNDNGFLYCIYVAIGQKKSAITRIVEVLTEKEAIHNTIIVSASSADAATLQYLAPYSGCAIGE